MRNGSIARSLNYHRFEGFLSVVLLKKRTLEALVTGAENTACTPVVLLLNITSSSEIDEPLYLIPTCASLIVAPLIFEVEPGFIKIPIQPFFVGVSELDMKVTPDVVEVSIFNLPEILKSDAEPKIEFLITVPSLISSVEPAGTDTVPDKKYGIGLAMSVVVADETAIEPERFIVSLAEPILPVIIPGGPKTDIAVVLPEKLLLEIFAAAATLKPILFNVKVSPEMLGAP